MLKKLAFLNRHSFRATALVVLLSIGNLQGESPKVSFTDKIRNSHAWSLWLGAIIPSILAHVSSERVIRAYNGDDKYKSMVTVATGIKWASFIVCFVSFYEWWFTDCKPWIRGLFKFNPRPKPVAEPVTPKLYAKANCPN